MKRAEGGFGSVSAKRIRAAQDAKREPAANRGRKLLHKLRRRKHIQAKTRNDIYIFNDGQYEKEQIHAEKWLRLLYENPVGGAPLSLLVKRKFVSRWYGMYCRTPLSAKQIPGFIEKYKIDMNGCEESYKSFAEFFSREKKDVFFPAEAKSLGSPCEGLVSAYTQIDPAQLIAAKGSYFSLAELFRDPALAQSYAGGTMLRIRLTPSHYHRMHFFDDGVVKSARYINGDLFSVSPLAVGRIPRLYCRNKRAVVQFSSKNFGDVVFVEVGATFVGSIVHCFKNGEKVNRGRMASYFKPGGSLLLIFFKKGAYLPDDNLLAQTQNGFETKASVGEIIGTAKGKK
jgi:phosphatidylserine decarboxylase